MWKRAAGVSDHELANFTLEKDLVLVRSAPTSYGTIILGKIRIPAINDGLGEGFVHVRSASDSIMSSMAQSPFSFDSDRRIHDPPNRVRSRMKDRQTGAVRLRCILGYRRRDLPLPVHRRGASERGRASDRLAGSADGR
jgi:hypothetical protein